jgi:hypothetical protein
VAALGSYGTNGAALFTEGLSQAILVGDKVLIEAGETIVLEPVVNGGTIASPTVASLGPPAINNLGAIAFHAFFTGGKDGIVVATPR